MKVMLEYVKATRKKNGYLTVSVAPRPPLRSAFCDFYFGVLLALSYDYMFSDTDFAQEKVNFNATTGNHNSSSYCCSSHSGWLFLK